MIDRFSLTLSKASLPDGGRAGILRTQKFDNENSERIPDEDSQWRKTPTKIHRH